MRGFYFGPSEVLYMIGLISVFFGLWVWIGLGQALFGVGAVLLATAFANAMRRSPQENKDAV
ncbi:MAG: hypothetical protein KG029_20210 [Bacteroidetes bacterium]|nr:hypothetical protein [Bacteroidota bacterium]